MTFQTCINFLLSAADLSKSYQLVKELDLHIISEILYFENISLVAIVGEGMVEMPGVAGRVFSTVSNEGINVQMISLGASEVAAYFIIEQRDKHKAIQAIHNEFFHEAANVTQ